MKRIISAIVLTVVLLAIMSSAVFAANESTLVISGNSTTVKAGETAVITLTIEENPGFAGIIFHPVIGGSNVPAPDWNWTPDMGKTELAFDLDTGSNIILSADDNCGGTGVLMDVQFHVPQNATPGEYTVTFVLVDCLSWTPDWELVDVPVELPTVTITVTAGTTSGCKHQNTTSVEAKAPTCTEEGYGAGIYCNDCHIYLSGHEKVSATGHQYEITSMDGTCSQGAVVTFTCTACGDSYTQSVEVPEHSFTAYVSNDDATCTQDGTETAVCDYCDATDTRIAEGSALGHTEVVKPGYAATCTEEGLSDGKYCSVCDEVLATQEVIPAGNHQYGDWGVTMQPSCTKVGQQTRICAVCGTIETGELDMLPHSVAVLEAVAATCTDPGLTEGTYCPGCQMVLAAQEEIPVADHSFGNWIVKTQPTTEAEGLEIRTCVACEKEESRPIAKLDDSSENNTNVIVVIINRFVNDTKLLLAVAAVVLCGAGLLVVVALKKKNS